jgi:hypothetical protein
VLKERSPNVVSFLARTMSQGLIWRHATWLVQIRSLSLS